MIQAEAPGKIILFGEHAVVYGRPALAATLDLKLRVTLKEGPPERGPIWRGLEEHRILQRVFERALDFLNLQRPPLSASLSGELPLGVGFGSSAALSVALLKALCCWSGQMLDAEALEAGALALERIFHGDPSGLDHRTILSGGCLCREDDRFRPLSIKQPIPLLLAWVPRHGTTRDVVSALRARYERAPDLYEGIFDHMAQLTVAGEHALVEADLPRLGLLFDLTQGLLNACGLSHPENEQMLHLARSHGALGAKLTGAGWGGAILALSEEPVLLAQIFREAGYPVHVAWAGTAP